LREGGVRGFARGEHTTKKGEIAGGLERRGGGPRKRQTSIFNAHKKTDKKRKEIAGEGDVRRSSISTIQEHSNAARGSTGGTAKISKQNMPRKGKRG